ncbi:serine hydrolase domain-containing protein [Neptunicella sp.]|uniref:serine hydrolase domain-containing protein n=1 Tax=Neptunicella sp. TaxID=2125986 RepID=UPI003F693289
MKKILVILLAIIALLSLVMPRWLGFSLWSLGDAIDVSTGMGAKLACSGHFVSGFDDRQNLTDLASYSPANQLLDIDYDETKNQVTASLLGMAETTATYRPGLGCTLDIGDTSALDRVTIPPLQTTSKGLPVVVDVNLQDRINAMLQQDNRAGYQTRALLMVKNGQVVAQAYAPGIDENTPLLGWSMGKSLTAMLQGRMQQLDMLSTDETHLFDQWQQDDRAQISLENLLQMSSGLEFDETYAPGTDSTRMLFSAHSASEVAMQSPLMLPIGTHFSYSSGTANLIARLLFQRAGGTVQAQLDFLHQQLLAPLGMSHTVFEPDPSGVWVGSSYIYASALDWAVLGQLMLNQGEFNGQQLLPKAWVEQASSPNHSDDPRYGYQFWLNRGTRQLRWPELPADAYAMNGNRQQAVMIIPSKQTVLVRLGWTSGSYPMATNFAALLQ